MAIRADDDDSDLDEEDGEVKVRPDGPYFRFTIKLRCKGM
jgi:hypothetical protein